MQVILTGVTGTLGSQLLFELLRMTDIKRVYLLIRKKGAMSAVSRLENLLSSRAVPKWVAENKEALLAKISVLEPEVFLDPNSWLARDRDNYFIHSAGFVNLTTDPSKRDEIFEENFSFTKKLFHCFSEYLKKFTYISTAFCIGDVGGLIANEYHDKKPAFRNFYEESKYKTEQFLFGQQKKDKQDKEQGLSIPQIQVLRPSVLGGNIYRGAQYFISNYMVYYLLGKFFYRNPFLKDTSIRFAVGMETGLNIVPVDYVAKTIAAVFTSGIEQLNITQSKSTNVPKGMKRIIETIGGFDNFSFVNSKKDGVVLEDKTVLERMYHKTIGLHLNKYLTSLPYEFDTALLESIMPMPKYDLEEYLANTISFAKRNDFRGEGW